MILFVKNRGGILSYLIIDKRMRYIEKQKLKDLGYNLIEIKENKNIYEEISSHTDIFVCKINNKLIVEKSQYKNIKQNVEKNQIIEEGDEKVSKDYPYDIKYNVCLIGKKAIHNFDYSEPKIKQELINNDYQLINTKQGYTNCSIAVIDDKSIILSDKGLYKTLKNEDLDILFLDYQPDIKLLKENSYSNKNGFIGGAISRVGNNMVVFGDLNNIDNTGKIREFIQKKNLNLIDFKGLDVIDYGGIVEI